MRLTLRAARRQRGWTHEHLARAASIHRATVYRLEAGDIRNPSTATVAALEDALGLSRGTLAFGADASYGTGAAHRVQRESAIEGSAK